MTDRLLEDLENTNPDIRRKALFSALSERRFELVAAIKNVAIEESDEEIAVLAAQVVLSLQADPPDITRETLFLRRLSEGSGLGAFSAADWEYFSRRAGKALLERIFLSMADNPPFGAAKFLGHALQNPDPEVRALAAGPAAQLAEPVLFAQLLGNVCDPDLTVAQAAYLAIQNLSPMRLVLQVDRAMRSGDEHVISTVAPFLPLLACGVLKPVLLRLSRNPRPDVAQKAFEGLSRIEQPIPQAAPVLSSGLASPSPIISPPATTAATATAAVSPPIPAHPSVLGPPTILTSPARLSHASVPPPAPVIAAVRVPASSQPVFSPDVPPSLISFESLPLDETQAPAASESNEDFMPPAFDLEEAAREFPREIAPQPVCAPLPAKPLSVPASVQLTARAVVAPVSASPSFDPDAPPDFSHILAPVRVQAPALKSIPASIPVAIPTPPAVPSFPVPNSPLPQTAPPPQQPQAVQAPPSFKASQPSQTVQAPPSFKASQQSQPVQAPQSSQRSQPSQPIQPPQPTSVPAFTLPQVEEPAFDLPGEIEAVGPSSDMATGHSFPKGAMVDSILERYPSFIGRPFSGLFKPASPEDHLRNVRDTLESLLAYLNFTFVQAYLFYSPKLPKTDQVVQDVLKAHLLGPIAVRHLHHLALAIREVAGNDRFFPFTLARLITESSERNPLFVVKEMYELVLSPPENLEEVLEETVSALGSVLADFKGILSNRLVMRMSPGAREPFLDLSGPRAVPLAPGYRPDLDLPPNEPIVLSSDRAEALGLFPYFTFDGNGLVFGIPASEDVSTLLERLSIQWIEG
ncbi:MAG: hypothetical protein WA705_22960 [Candidatus Ozemobacteraceae bacterium]